MAIYAALHTLSATSVMVVPPSTQPQEVHLHNQNKSSNQFIYLGNANVSTTNSMHIDPAESITLTLMPSQSLFAVSEPVGLKLGVLAIRKD